VSGEDHRREARARAVDSTDRGPRPGPVAEAHAGGVRSASSNGDRYVDLSQPLFNGMPHSHLCTASFRADAVDLGYEADIEVTLTHLEMSAHVGTHIDAPRHFIPGGATLDAYPAARFCRPAVSIDMRRDGPVPVTERELRQSDPGIEPGDIVILYFGYADRFAHDDYHSHPYLDAGAAEFLVEKGIGMLAVDTLTPDVPGRHRPAGFDFPIHRILLGADILIMENLGRGAGHLIGTRFSLVCFPMQVRNADGAPVVPVAIA